MYTKIKNVQIIIALLKEFNIKHIVLSPGARNVPIVVSVENDPFFTCYSVVDERSAAYFALGLAKELNRPVAISCTSSTATCNYLPGITEAFYQKVPLVVLTGDRHPYLMGQLEDQMIIQPNMYQNVCRKSVNLPMVYRDNSNDLWYCQRLVNEALLELDHHGRGPVHINFPINASLEDISDASVAELPKVQAIKRILPLDSNKIWHDRLEELKEAKKILIIYGMSEAVSKTEKQNIETFAKKYNCVIATEHMSNFKNAETINTYIAAQSLNSESFEEMLPDIVVSLGGNFTSRLKDLLREKRGQYKHWIINEDGSVVDVFKSLSVIFECTPDYFFAYFSENAGDINNDRNYYTLWEECSKRIKIPEFTFSNVYSIQELSKSLPDNSLLHLGILNATRIMQLFNINNTIEVYSNIGAYGIDGSMSTFFGQSAATERLCFLVLGDLSFFYDMNSIGIRNINKNVRIMMINNQGGAEFHYTMGKRLIPSINRHIAAEHHSSAKEWVKSQGFKYLSAINQNEFKEQLSIFTSSAVSDSPIFFEVFTNKETDAEVLKSFFTNII